MISHRNTGKGGNWMRRSNQQNIQQAMVNKIGATDHTWLHGAREPCDHWPDCTEQYTGILHTNSFLGDPPSLESSNNKVLGYIYIIVRQSRNPCNNKRTCIILINFLTISFCLTFFCRVSSCWKCFTSGGQETVFYLWILYASSYEKQTQPKRLLIKCC